jgi:hypothetical protein
VTIESPDSAFEGTVEILTGGRTCYRECRLPAGGLATLHFDVIFTDDMGEFAVRAKSRTAVTEFDKSKAQGGSLHGVGAGRKLVCAMPAPPSADILSLFEEHSWVLVPMAAAELPDEPDDLRPFSLIVLGETRPEEIKPQAREAIINRVRFGGRLFLPAGTLSADWIFPAEGAEFRINGPLLEARRGLGRVFTLRSDVNFRMLSAEEQEAFKSRMLEIMVSSGGIYEPCGPVPAVNRTANAFFEPPERYMDMLPYCKALLALQFLIFALLTLSGRRFLAFSLTAVSLVSLAAYMMLPAPGGAEAESMGICISRAGESETLDIRFYGLSRLSTTVLMENETEISLGDSDLLIPVAGHYNALIEMEGALEAGRTANVKGFGLDAYNPRTFISMSVRAGRPRVGIHRADGGMLVVENLSGSDLAGCMVTDFKTATVIGGLKNGARAGIPLEMSTPHEQALKETNDLNTRTGRLMRNAFKYLAELRPTAGGGVFFLGYEAPEPGRIRKNGVLYLDHGRLLVAELPSQ